MQTSVRRCGAVWPMESVPAPPVSNAHHGPPLPRYAPTKIAASPAAAGMAGRAAAYSPDNGLPHQGFSPMPARPFAATALVVTPLALGRATPLLPTAGSAQQAPPGTAPPPRQPPLPNPHV